jgi:hypothetical protein
MGVKSGRSLARSEHRRHDRLLVTRFAMDDAYPGEQAEARSLIESCDDCALLADDIRLISASVTRLPRPARTRDFSITAEQAERLKGSRLTRWLRSLSGPGWTALRPVSAAALSIGLVMAVVGASLPQVPSSTTFSNRAPAETGAPMLDGAQEPATVPDDNVPDIDALPPRGPAEVEEPGPDGVAGVASDASENPVTERLNMAYATDAPGDTGTAGDDFDSFASEAAATDPARDLLVYIGLVIAALGLGLLALAWFARRYVADPLLR